MSHIIVMGAGVVGVTTAWYLRQQGFDVTVIDRRADVAQETSYANGGQISVSHAEPWANPNAPKQIIQWLFDKNAPLRLKPNRHRQFWQWGMAFLGQCQANKTAHNIEQLVTLGNYSKASLKALRQQLDLNYLQRSEGILHFYTSQKDFDACQKATQIMQTYGCDRKILSANDAYEIDPALQYMAQKIIGATYTASDESGNALYFTQAMRQKCEQAGVNFLFNTQIMNIHANQQTQKIESIEIKNTNIKNSEIQSADIRNTDSDTLSADKFVLCLGSYSAVLARKLGMRLNIYPAKGYSVSIPVIQADKIPTVSMIDDAYKLVFSRFTHLPKHKQAKADTSDVANTDILRVAGMAELGGQHKGFDTHINTSRAQLITNRVKALFPESKHYLNFATPNYWTGLRPATPSNVPYIRQSRYANLFLNTGHGTLGWTHACGSAKLITSLICQEQADIDFHSS